MLVFDNSQPKDKPMTRVFNWSQGTTVPPMLTLYPSPRPSPRPALVASCAPKPRPSRFPTRAPPRGRAGGAKPRSSASATRGTPRIRAGGCGTAAPAVACEQDWPECGEMACGMIDGEGRSYCKDHKCVKPDCGKAVASLPPSDGEAQGLCYMHIEQYRARES